MSTTLDERRIGDLGDRILRPGDGGYDDARAHPQRRSSTSAPR